MFLRDRQPEHAKLGHVIDQLDGDENVIAVDALCERHDLPVRELSELRSHLVQRLVPQARVPVAPLTHLSAQLGHGFARRHRGRPRLYLRLHHGGVQVLVAETQVGQTDVLRRSQGHAPSHTPDGLPHVSTRDGERVVAPHPFCPRTHLLAGFEVRP
ncbi:MAG: hypothetical protein CVT86_01725 [Alphaproteobacteria bacterium HGW-Alphaproteobacteria-8]|nr:MAG: hypothetical protein CVT86_01725 [Alphaproteobacteria bacterium HGW-Alphaproteobacteria-8]